MNQVAIKHENPLVKLNSEMEQRTTQFQAALPAHIPVERFKRVLLTAVQNNAALATADRRTFFNSAMKAAQDGLLPDGREGAMVIYKTKMKEGNREFWVEAVQWMPMIAGIRKKVRNSGEIATWEAKAVYEKDTFDYVEGFEPNLIHKPHIDGDPGPVRAAYSIAKLKSGEISFEVMSKFQIDRIRAMSKAKDSGPWRDHYAEMCRKTVARRHSKVLPMSTDLDDLIRRDDDLYDMEGASDRNQAEAPQRPKLTDFVDMPQNAPMTEDPKGPKPAETVDAETGEITDGDENPTPEFSAADAMELGRVAHGQAKSLFSVPAELSEDHKEAWRAGWRDADEEAKARKG